MNLFREVGSALKDSAVTAAAKTAINSLVLQEYGEMLSLRVDSRQKTIHADILLKGESESIQVAIQRYDLQVANQAGTITLNEISTSREWITALCRKQIEGQSIEIDPRLGRCLKVLL